MKNVPAFYAGFFIDVVNVWTLSETNPFVSLVCGQLNDISLSSPAMMAGFFLPKTQYT